MIINRRRELSFILPRGWSVNGCRVVVGRNVRMAHEENEEHEEDNTSNVVRIAPFVLLISVFSLGVFSTEHGVSPAKLTVQRIFFC